MADTIKFLVRLFDTTTKAADGSVIPRGVCEEYLRSDDYKEVMQNKIAWGGITHKDRKIDPKYDGIIGIDDQVLVSENASHYLTKMYFKDAQDPVLYGEAETFDPSLFAGKRAEIIQNVIGMIKTGVKMNISIVIQALWDSNNMCRKIIRLKGFDFTQNNSFPNAGLVKTMSVAEINPKDERASNKQFSDSNGNYQDCKMQTKIFSTEVEIISDDPEATELFKKLLESDKDNFTFSDIFDAYPANSVERKIGNTIKGRSISKKNLKKLSDQYNRIHPAKIVADIADDSDTGELWKTISKLVTDDQREALRGLMRNGKYKLANVLVSIPKTDPDYEQKILQVINRYLRQDPDNMQFSTVNSVKDRELLILYPRISMINRIFKIYNKYYETNKENLSQHELQFLIQMFIQDIQLLVKRVQEYILNGTTLTTLYALGRFGDDVVKSANEYSKIYRKILILEKNMGFIPELKYKQFITAMNNFYRVLCNKVFGLEIDDQVTLIDKI